MDRSADISFLEELLGIGQYQRSILEDQFLALHQNLTIKEITFKVGKKVIHHCIENAYNLKSEIWNLCFEFDKDKFRSFHWQKP